MTVQNHSSTPSRTDLEISSAQHLKELTGLNWHFVQLMCEQHEHSRRIFKLHEQLRGRLETLNDADRWRLATCPYSLFDLQFSDVTWWEQRLTTDAKHQAHSPTPLTEFTLAALTYAQRLALENSDLSCMLLGMNSAVTTLFRKTTIGKLLDESHNASKRLSIRLISEPNFWTDLVNYVQEDSPGKYLAAQTAALQIMAARR